MLQGAGGAGCNILAATLRESRTLELWEWREEDLSFRSVASIPLGCSPVRMATGHFDGNRVPDLSIACLESGEGGDGKKSGENENPSRITLRIVLDVLSQPQLKSPVAMDDSGEWIPTDIGTGDWNLDGLTDAACLLAPRDPGRNSSSGKWIVFQGRSECISE